MKSGKKFENNFKSSVPKEIFYYRFRDGTSSWDKNENSLTRFQAKNICDCMLYDAQYLYLLELKSHKGSSLPLSAIRENQIKSLMEASQHANIIAGLVVNFADKEETYFMPIKLAHYWFYQTDRKSIPIKEFRDNCIQINSYKKKVNYTYDVSSFIDRAIKELI